MKIDSKLIAIVVLILAVAGQCWFKDVSICGIQSPVIYD